MNTFRNRVSLDYNPTISSLLQLVRLLQAEFESASLSGEGARPDRKARAAALQPPGMPEGPKALPPRKGGGKGASEAQAKAPPGK